MQTEATIQKKRTQTSGKQSCNRMHSTKHHHWFFVKCYEHSLEALGTYGVCFSLLNMDTFSCQLFLECRLLSANEEKFPGFRTATHCSSHIFIATVLLQMPCFFGSDTIGRVLCSYSRIFCTSANMQSELQGCLESLDLLLWWNEQFLGCNQSILKSLSPLMVQSWRHRVLPRELRTSICHKFWRCGKYWVQDLEEKMEVLKREV